MLSCLATSSIAFLSPFSMANSGQAANMLNSLSANGLCVPGRVIDGFIGQIDCVKEGHNLSNFRSSLARLRKSHSGDGFVTLGNSPETADLISTTRELNELGFSTVRSAAQHTMAMSSVVLLGFEAKENEAFLEAFEQLLGRYKTSAKSDVPVLTIAGGRVVVGRALPIEDVLLGMRRAGISDATLRIFLGSILLGDQDGFTIWDSRTEAIEEARPIMQDDMRYSVLAAAGAPLWQPDAAKSKMNIESAFREVTGGEDATNGDVFWITVGRPSKGGVKFIERKPLFTSELVFSNRIPKHWKTQRPEAKYPENRRDRGFVRIPLVFYNGKLVINLKNVKGPDKEVIVYNLLKSVPVLGHDGHKLAVNITAATSVEMEELKKQAIRYFESSEFSKKTVKLPPEVYKKALSKIKLK